MYNFQLVIKFIYTCARKYIYTKWILQMNSNDKLFLLLLFKQMATTIYAIYINNKYNSGFSV